MDEVGALNLSTFNLVDKSGMLLGVAFCVNVLDTERFGTFLLTAGHCVKERYINNEPVHLQNGEGTYVASAIILYCQWAPVKHDCAIIYTDRWIAPPLRCGLTSGNIAGHIRGSPEGVASIQTNMRAWIAGTEVKGGLTLLDVVLPDMTVIETPIGNRRRNSFHEVLRGLSGGPVFSDDGSVVGLVSTRNTRGLANRVYATPIATLLPELSKHGFAIRLSGTSHVRQQATEAALVGRLIARSLKTPEDEHALWEDLSSLFYGGSPVDQTLAAVMRDAEAHGISNILERARGNFLLARFALKRGDRRRAHGILAQILTSLADDQSAEFRTLRSLVELRILVEALPPNGTKARLGKIDKSLGMIADSTDFSDRMRAYEIASAAGREAFSISTLLFMAEPAQILRHYLRVRNLHHGITLQYGPVLYDKQGMVDIALRLLSLLWNTDSVVEHDRVENIIETVADGHSGATARKNLNAHFPFMMGEAVALKAVGQTAESWAQVLLTAEGLRRSGLALSHEGVAHVYAYMRAEQPLLAAALKRFHQYGLSSGLQAFESDRTLDARGDNDLRTAVRAVSDRLTSDSPASELVGVTSAELFGY